MITGRAAVIKERGNRRRDDPASRMSLERRRICGGLSHKWSAIIIVNIEVNHERIPERDIVHGFFIL